MPPPDNKAKPLFSKVGMRWFISFLVVLIVVMIDSLFGTGGQTSQGPQSKAMVQARAIGLALHQYAGDHGGKYPEGASSTEVFQKLLDGKYVTDPAIFFYPLPGKMRPESDALKPENVGWDVTYCVDGSTPDGLPVVFLTGYAVNYQAGASAVPLHPPPPLHFTAVCYTGDSARALQHPAPDGSFSNFIAADFDAKGRTYRQLTPEGPLPTSGP